MATLCRTRVCRAALLCVLVLAACPAARGEQWEVGTGGFWLVCMAC